jgi:alanyl-tRNA synthetase
MNQFVPIFLGEKKCPYSPGRAADTQKCIRAGGKHNDLDDVGMDTYHHTFFEMLGNWSFGDYFKREAIAWAWELITGVWKFPPARLYATVYAPDKAKGDPSEFDQEAYDAWLAKFREAGFSDAEAARHIVHGGKKDNFWMMGDTGPCGPCSELHVDLTPAGDTAGTLVNKGSPLCIEIWNLVFMQFNAEPDGSFSPLPARNVDTGMGFERVASILQCTKNFTDFTGIISNYETDIFRPIFDELERLCGKRYGSTLPKNTTAGDAAGDAWDSIDALDTPVETTVINKGDNGSPTAGDWKTVRDWLTDPANGVLGIYDNAHTGLPFVVNTPTIRHSIHGANGIGGEEGHLLVKIGDIIRRAVRLESNVGKFSTRKDETDTTEKADIFYATALLDGRPRIVRIVAKPVVLGAHDEIKIVGQRGRRPGDHDGRHAYNVDAVEYENTAPGGPELSQHEVASLPSSRSGVTNRATLLAEVKHLWLKTSTGVASRKRTEANAETTGDAAAGNSEQERVDIAFRVIADHIRTLSFAIADGIQPGNTDRNYVLRRILRRAVRYGRSLGFREPFFYKLVDVLAAKMGTVFPELAARQTHVKDVIRAEEEAFNKTLDRGIALFEDEVAKLANNTKNAGADAAAGTAATLSGAFVFALYDTYGFPLDLTELLARERGLAVDTAGFDALMREQRERAKAAQKKEVIALSALTDKTPTTFTGYDAGGTGDADGSLAADATVREVVELKAGTLAVVLDRSPFYAEMGGQVGDTGELADAAGNHWRVINTQKSGDTFLHLLTPAAATATAALPTAGATVRALVDRPRRLAISRHHTATHLLHWALHKVAGGTIAQKGSSVDEHRLTFDFNSAPLTREQVREVEQLVNDKILENAPVSWTEVAHADVKGRADIMQFFGDKYGERVRVVQIGGTAGALDGYSMELCGGTHVRATGELGTFRIVSENAIAAGVRRIEALAGNAALDAARADAAKVAALAALAGAAPADLLPKFEQLLADKSAAEKKLRSHQQREQAALANALAAGAGVSGQWPECRCRCSPQNRCPQPIQFQRRRSRRPRRRHSPLRDPRRPSRPREPCRQAGGHRRPCRRHRRQSQRRRAMLPSRHRRRHPCRRPD